MKTKTTIESKVREIKRATKRRFSAEEKIRIVLEVLRADDSLAAICRREGIHPNLYYNWSKEFLEAGICKLRCSINNLNSKFKIILISYVYLRHVIVVNLLFQK